ncbi:MAG: hypothetical protein O2909_07390 [Chloroflexi bacterium]|nr:hypothetical protein [Chloroflexota bacterium]MDA1219249.1 hypothetical protein [Chloroflexota bacterium]PKB57827.1 MAG: hypothetical protein BZY73_01110 [SAR202 cluster bacterium Casp-Chloro-G3]
MTSPLPPYELTPYAEVGLKTRGITRAHIEYVLTHGTSKNLDDNVFDADVYFVSITAKLTNGKNLRILGKLGSGGPVAVIGANFV